MGESFDKACDYAEAMRRLGKTYEEAQELLEQAWEYILAGELADFRQHRKEERAG